MPDEKVLDLVEVVRRGDEVVVKAYDYVALGMPDGDVLDSAFAGTRVVQMLKRRRRRGEINGAGVPFSATRISREASAAAPASCGARLSSSRASASGRAWVAIMTESFKSGSLLDDIPSAVPERGRFFDARLRTRNANG